MNPELQAQIDEIQNISSPTDVEEMILQLIQKFQSQPDISTDDARQLGTIFIQYETWKLTKSREIRETLISYLTSLGIQDFKKGIEENIDSTITEPKLAATETSRVLTPLSETEVLEGFPSMTDLPRFKTYKEFIDSDFFERMYKLGELETTIQFNRLFHEEDVLLLRRRENIKKLQSLLVFLGYMEESDLFGEYTFSEEDIQIISYYGIGGPKTFGCVRVFQGSVGLDEDGIVGQDTKRVLYRKIYETFHETEKRNM